tara:strand:- start:182542 stop:182964 length:423 start_codon:yes stop_codon:yes gene_type:complete
MLKLRHFLYSAGFLYLSIILFYSIFQFSFYNQNFNIIHYTKGNLETIIYAIALAYSWYKGNQAYFFQNSVVLMKNHIVLLIKLNLLIISFFLFIRIAFGDTNFTNLFNREFFGFILFFCLYVYAKRFFKKNNYVPPKKKD